MPSIIGAVFVPAFTAAVEDSATLIGAPQLLCIVPHLQITALGTSLLNFGSRLDVFLSKSLDS